MKGKTRRNSENDVFENAEAARGKLTDDGGGGVRHDEPEPFAHLDHVELLVGVLRRGAPKTAG